MEVDSDMIYMSDNKSKICWRNIYMKIPNNKGYKIGNAIEIGSFNNFLFFINIYDAIMNTIQSVLDTT